MCPPMLISQMQEPFDDADWICELKLDGCRCVAYLEEDRVVLRNVWIYQDEKMGEFLHKVPCQLECRTEYRQVGLFE